MNGDQSASETITHIAHLLVLEFILELDGESIGLPFEIPADGVHGDAHDSFEGRQDHLEHEESENGGWLRCDLFCEVEGAQEGWGVQEGWEEGKDGEDMELGDGHHLGGVKVVPVAEFVGQDSLDLFRLVLLDECVKDDDVFAPWKTEEIRITMRAALRSIDFIQVFEGEFEFAGEVLNPLAKFAFGERG